MPDTTSGKYTCAGISRQKGSLPTNQLHLPPKEAEACQKDSGCFFSAIRLSPCTKACRFSHVGHEDRDYMKSGSEPPRPPQGPAYGRPPGAFDGAPVTKWLFISNIAVFFLNILLTPEGTPGGTPEGKSPLTEWGYFSVDQGFYHLQIWRVLTFQFLHANINHLLSNMIGIYFFAPHLERWMSSRIFTFYYLLCGIAGVLFYTFLALFTNLFGEYGTMNPMVGASAGIFGILAAFYFIAPNARVLLFFIIPMKMRTLGIIFFAYEVLNIIGRGGNYGGSVGHLGGALLGILIMKNSTARQLLNSLAAIGTGTRTKSHSKGKFKDAQIVRESNRRPIEITEEVNRILDKISEEGIQSLTPKERETLDRSRKN